MNMKRLIATIVAVAALSLALSPAAIAQNSSAEVYGGQGAEPVSGATDSGAEPAARDSLPFTGLDVSLVAGGGLLLLLIGVGMARVIPKHEHQ